MLKNILAMLVGLTLCILCTGAESTPIWQSLLAVYGAMLFTLGLILLLSDLNTDIESLFDFSGRLK